MYIPTKKRQKKETKKKSNKKKIDREGNKVGIKEMGTSQTK